jgi:hypothetical protein
LLVSIFHVFEVFVFVVSIVLFLETLFCAFNISFVFAL